MTECMLCGNDTETTVTIGDSDKNLWNLWSLCVTCICSLLGPDSPERDKIHQANLANFERELNDD